MIKAFFTLFEKSSDYNPYLYYLKINQNYKPKLNYLKNLTVSSKSAHG